MPLHIQINIIHAYIVVFGDALDISEYFYKIRKIWRDIGPRLKLNQFRNLKEKMDLLPAREAYRSVDGK
jgi:hypothetical protein